jgi:uncharacterized protein YggL (DUF469 family)
MLDLVISKDELVQMFINETIKDTNNGWLYEDSQYINIAAIHEKDPKYIYDVANAQFYKLTSIDSKNVEI